MIPRRMIPMIDLTPIFAGVILVIFGVLTGFLIPFLRRKMSDSTYEQVKETVWIVVEAAEMIFYGPGRGQEKKEYVKKTLEQMGYTFDEVYLDNLIEACVLELKAQEMEQS